MGKKIFLIIAILVLLSVISAKSLTDIHSQRIDSILTIAIQKYGFNGTILVAEEGKIVYKNAIGYSNFKTKEKLTTNSMFKLASLSKAFTAMGIMILKERGKLDYENDILKYFPDFPYNEGTTIRNLLNHTSGLPDYERLLKKKWDRTKIANNNDVLQMISKYKPKISFKPGEKFEYCNTGYALLALIIEKVSGLTYREFLKKNIFEKLNMKRTKVLNMQQRPELISDYAYGYVFSVLDGGYELIDNVKTFEYLYFLDGLVGDGAVNSSIEDMFLWDQALSSEILVNNKTLNEAFTPPALIKKDFKTDYGFGWHINNTELGKIIDHSGSWSGCINYFYRNVDKKQTLIILTNNSFSPYFGLFRNFIDILNDKKELLLPKKHIHIVLKKKLLKNNMISLRDKVEIFITDTLNYQHNENAINKLAYSLLLETDRTFDAIELFKINVRLFPESANVYDSLGEAYIKASQYELAIENYEKAFKMDPSNKNAEHALKKMKKERK